MAERLAGGDLGARLPVEAFGEIGVVSKTRIYGGSPSCRRTQNSAATETSVALCRVAATPGSDGGFSQSMEAEMGSRAKRGWRTAVHQQSSPAHVSRRRSLLDVSASLHWPR